MFPTRPAGYYLAVRWAQSFGAVLRAGVEGTSSYGAGLTWALQEAGIEVAEINNSDRAGRRRRGKSDPLDAYAAARAALAGHGSLPPQTELPPGDTPAGWPAGLPGPLNSQLSSSPSSPKNF